MKKNIKTVITLCLISGLSGLLLYVFNNFTAEKIKENYINKIKTIAFDIYDNSSSIEIVDISGYEFVVSEVKCFNDNQEEVGSLFEAKGKNKFGEISLLVAIENNTIKDVKILSMNQSYSKIAKNFITNNFSDELSFSELEGLDLKCGATSSATLIKALLDDVVKVYGDRYEG